MNRVLLTGGAGFVGSHTVRHLLAETDCELVLPVTFRHRGNADRIRSVIRDHPEWEKRLTVMYHDLRAPFSPRQVHALEGCDLFVNIASESHVDRSIAEPFDFTMNNVAVMLTVLELARQVRPEKVLHISTDEVYGPASGDPHVEWSTIIPSNPYSASKAAQEAIAISYWRTYGVPLIISNTMNIIGEMQDPEKFVPKLIRAALSGMPVDIHVSPDGAPGSRFYLHARNQADALLFLATQVEPVMHPYVDRPGRFHVVGEMEIDNFKMARLVGEMVGSQVKTRPVSFHASRPGHDLRYALDGTKLAERGWKPPVPFYESLERTVHWTLRHPEWLD